MGLFYGSISYFLRLDSSWRSEGFKEGSTGQLLGCSVQGYHWQCSRLRGAKIKTNRQTKILWKWWLSKKGNWPVLKLEVQLSYVFFKRGRFRPVLVIWWRKPTFTVWHIYWYQLCINTRKRPNLNETNISWRKGVKVFLMNSVRRVLLLADEWCLFDVKA